MTCPSDILFEWTARPQRTILDPFWTELERCRRSGAACFEICPQDARHAWIALASRADAAVPCHRDGRTVGMLFAVARPGSLAAEVHAAFTDAVSREEAFGICEHARDMVAERTPWRNLLAVVPRQWRHVRLLAARLGFREACRLPELVRLDSLGRHVEGVILHLDLAPYREAAHA